MVWKMITNTHFENEQGEYKGIVHAAGAYGCGYWCIMKGDKMIDEVFQHPPVPSSNNSELTAKATVEKKLKILVTPSSLTNQSKI